MGSWLLSLSILNIIHSAVCINSLLLLCLSVHMSVDICIISTFVVFISFYEREWERGSEKESGGWKERWGRDREREMERERAIERERQQGRERERERESRGKEKKNLKQPPCLVWSSMWVSISRPWDNDPTRNQEIYQLRHQVLLSLLKTKLL